MGTSGAESLAAVADVFLGMTEAPLLVRPYLDAHDALRALHADDAGMATVAGSVLIAYAEMLGGGDYAGHLVDGEPALRAGRRSWSSKVMVPETGAARDGSARDGALEPRRRST